EADMSNDRRAIKEIKEGADRINARLKAHGCAPYEFKGTTLYKPVVTRLMSVTPEGARLRGDFLVKFPENDGDIVVLFGSEAQFSMYFSVDGGRNTKGFLLPHDD